MHIVDKNELHLVCGGGKEAAGAVAAIGGGVGASRAISVAGGLGALGNGAIAAGTAGAVGVGAAAVLGWEIGTALYNNNKVVRGAAEKLMNNVGPTVTKIGKGLGFNPDHSDSSAEGPQVFTVWNR